MAPRVVAKQAVARFNFRIKSCFRIQSLTRCSVVVLPTRSFVSCHYPTTSAPSRARRSVCGWRCSGFRLTESVVAELAVYSRIKYICWDGIIPYSRCICWDGIIPYSRCICWDGIIPYSRCICWDGIIPYSRCVCWDGIIPYSHCIQARRFYESAA